MFRQIGTPEIILILAVLVLLFGAKKLPELARGSGRALRIFKAETKGLINDDDDDEPAAGTDATAAREIEASGDKPQPTASAEAERARDTTD